MNCSPQTKFGVFVPGSEDIAIAKAKMDNLTCSRDMEEARLLFVQIKDNVLLSREDRIEAYIGYAKLQYIKLFNDLKMARSSVLDLMECVAEIKKSALSAQQLGGIIEGKEPSSFFEVLVAPLEGIISKRFPVKSADQIGVGSPPEDELAKTESDDDTSFTSDDDDDDASGFRTAPPSK